MLRHCKTMRSLKTQHKPVVRTVPGCSRRPCMHGRTYRSRQTTMPIKASESGRGEASEVDPASVATTGPGNVEAASSATSEQWNPGMYGPWRVEQQDLIEVWSYRAGLLTSAAAALIVGAALLAPADGALREALRPLENPACVAGVAGFGVSVYFIHIYVAQLKRFVQVLWAVGSASAIWLMMTQGQAVPEYVAAQPSSLWLVGPFFAAVTGVAFKEGVCYGKGEAFALTLLVPTLMLGHLSSLLPASMEQALGVVVLALFAVFAGRKVGQAAKDDIGDKSVFEFLKLPPDEQERLVDALQRDGQLQ